MDVAKAKNVVIALLVAFNIFLLVNNLTFVKGQGVQKETIRNTEAVLQMRGVTLECSIPTKPGGQHRLEYINNKLDRQALTEVLLGSDFEETGQEAINEQGEATVQAYEFMSGSKKLKFISDTAFVFTDDMAATEEQPDTAIDLGNDEKVKKMAQQFLESAGLMQGEYIVDSLIRNEDGSAQINFIETYEGFLVFDNYCNVTLDENGVRRLEYGKVYVNGFSNQSIERFDAYQALLSRFESGSNLTITAIDSGYKLDLSMDGVETVEMLPVWRVKIKGRSEPEYIYPYDSGKVNGGSTE